MDKAPTGVRFILNDQRVEIGDLPASTTLLQYLRDHRGHCGTKEGCAEGDCGACTVVVGELRDGGMAWKAVNSCIRFLPSFDGCEVVTVEGLQDGQGRLHPVQQAMVDNHASQCGFCTPGFVMSLFGLYLSGDTATRAQVVDALAGNLCRCTGYRPIIDAGCRMQDYAPPQRWSREDVQSEERVARLQALRRETTGNAMRLAGFYAPTTLKELAGFYAAHPDHLLLAGCTDIGLWVTKQLRDLPPLLYLGEVAELSMLRTTGCGCGLEIGAAVPLEEAFAAIVGHYPMLAELANRFASPPIRHSGTLCGNITNGSPIGDSMPILIALDATVQLRRGEAARSLALEDLYLGYQKKALMPGEFVQSVRIPLPLEQPPGRQRLVASYKVSKRFDQDISAVCSGFAIDIQDGVVAGARLAYGGMAAVPKRALFVEAALAGKPWSEQSILAAFPAFARDFQPLSDMRASGAYRLEVARKLLLRLYRQQTTQASQAWVSVHALAEADLA